MQAKVACLLALKFAHAKLHLEGGEMEDPLGEHYIIELYECSHEVLDNLEQVQTTLLDAADISGATIIDQRFHKFSPQGVSGVVVIAESHLSIHTWPELGYAALDLFTCSKDMDIQKALDLLKQVFKPGDMVVEYIQRGLMDPTYRKNQRLHQYRQAHLAAGRQ
tara:strand:+ start:45112 stop:45603 length:492 start_codon:yes stop_codon:yes gene_type:complete